MSSYARLSLALVVVDTIIKILININFAKILFKNTKIAVWHI
jgi:hypothetical protein